MIWFGLVLWHNNHFSFFNTKYHPTIPPLCSLPKIHKPNTLLRPIISNTLIGLRAFDLVSSRVWWEAATNKDQLFPTTLVPPTK